VVVTVFQSPVTMLLPVMWRRNRPIVAAPAHFFFLRHVQTLELRNEGPEQFRIRLAFGSPALRAK